ncbi:MAG: hypothetical protein VX733_10705 [Candidatus Latescibacterota bacterium]|nr:hypothetical protein [Candidatus Latescibacterota bacterium]
MRQRRTIYFNDARHYYLFVFEPPMRLEDAWVPVDEVADTGVDTFIYGVSRDDGWFYPSRVGTRFGQDMVGNFEQAAYWRVWQNMQSLVDRDLDPLQVLIDRAHDRGMDFLSSLRMGAYAGLDQNLSTREGGPGMADPSVRDFMQRAVVELAGYDAEGVELDFAGAPGGTAYWFPQDRAAALGSEMTEWLRRTRDAVNHVGDRVVGARVYPTREANEKTGLQVERWLEEGLVDYVVPLVYGFMILDGAMPIDWIVRAAHARDVSVYAMLQPYYADESRALIARQYPTPEMYRGAAANAWQAGVDGMYSWFMRWPLGDRERAVLSELSSPDQIVDKDKHYFLRRSTDVPYVVDVDYPAHLPISMDPASDLGRTFAIPVRIGDDVEATGKRIGRMSLRLALTDLVSDDRLEIRVNGERLPLMQGVRRFPIMPVSPYQGQWLEIELSGTQRLRRGENRLEIALLERPEGLRSKVVVEDVEVTVAYDLWPSRLLE